MKSRCVIAIVLCLALFCTACHRTTPPVSDTTAPQPSSDSTGNASAPTDPEPTDAASAPTNPEPKIPLWYNPNPQQPSYEAFFSGDYDLHSFFSDPYWYVRHDDTFVRASFVLEGESKLPVVNTGGGRYHVPGCDNLTGYDRIGNGSDGKYTYMNSSTDIIRIDLRTGETETIYTCDRLHQVVCYDSLVLMILAENAGERNIYRMYLPTLDTDTFYEGIPVDTPLYYFSLSGIYSTQKPFIWTMMNPEMTALLEKELANPDSIYMVNNFTGQEKDYSSIWSNLSLDTTGQHTPPPYSLLHDVQSHTGIHAWVKCAYNPTDGSYEETTGIIDRCWYGSGYSHDHYDPNEYDLSPAWNVSEAISIPNISLPAEPHKMYEEDIYAYTTTDYAYIDGFICQETASATFQILFELDLTEVKFAPSYLYGITPDNTLMQVSYDGTVRNTIYTADSGTLSELVYGSGKLYFLENKATLMEIDIPAQICRSLLNIPHYNNMYLDAPNTLFFESAKGLSVGMYIVDLDQMTLEKTHRL